MGRVGNNEPQVQETIGDSFPESEQPVTKPRSQAPSNNKPQKNSPHTGGGEEDDDLIVLNNKAWNSNLFDCMNDPQNALITACFPCITFGQIAEILDSGNTTCATSGVLYGCIAFCIAIPCIMSCTYRTKLRAKFGLMESPAQDWLVHYFCEWCALCQEYRELQHMGYDPAIGWPGNQAKMRQHQNQQFGIVTYRTFHTQNLRKN
ncbi:protein PLANT CADMIUM RESISTANCE 7-like [Primulina eburnea]|uniref:protein PLANT CADMIUM RESISTANCE 7-like n=1 Tax=Primulina eburnea TaxID=1245227 RepID=UPI003C6BE9D7